MNIVVYGKENCSYCLQAKNLLEGMSIPYTYESVDSPEMRKLLIEEIAPGARTVPVVMIDGNWIGGFTELREYVLKTRDENGREILFG